VGWPRRRRRWTRPDKSDVVESQSVTVPGLRLSDMVLSVPRNRAIGVLPVSRLVNRRRLESPQSPPGWLVKPGLNACMEIFTKPFLPWRAINHSARLAALAREVTAGPRSL
jgi:hypothetical protein